MAQTQKTLTPTTPSNTPTLDVEKSDPAEVKEDIFITPERAVDFAHFIIENVFAEKLGATILDYKVSSLSFRADVTHTKNPDCVYNAATKLSKDTTDTLDIGLKNYPDGNMPKLKADAKALEKCDWDGMLSDSSKRLLGEADPKFDGQAYNIIDQIVFYKSAGLPDNDDLLSLLQRGEQKKLVKLTQDSYVEHARAAPEVESVIRTQTLPNAIEYSNTIFRLYEAYTLIMMDGINHDKKGENGFAETLNAVTVGKQHLGQISALGESAAEHIASDYSSFARRKPGGMQP